MLDTAGELDQGSGCSGEAGLVAAVRAPINAAIAAIAAGPAARLVAVLDEEVSDSRAAIARLLPLAGGEPAAVAEDRALVVVHAIHRWLRRAAVADIVSLPELHVATSRRTLLRRVDAIARRAARHHQPRLAPLMRAARSAASTALSSGAERVLRELVDAPLPDEAWLHAVGEFAALHARPGGLVHNDGPDDAILALLLLQSGREDGPSPAASRGSSGAAS